MPDTVHDLDTALRDAARATIWHDSPDDVARDLAHAVHSVIASLPGAVCGGLSEVRDGELRGLCPTSETAAELDLLQRRHHEGPAVTMNAAADGRSSLRVDDLRGAPATAWWPVVAPRAVELGHRSLLCVRLPLGAEHPATSLTVYGRHAGVFGDEARRLTAVFAAHAAGLIDRRLTTTPAGADLLAQARGILMERSGVGAHRAMAQLLRCSQTTGLDVTVLAQWLVDDAGRRADRPVLDPDADSRVPSQDGRVAARP